MTRPLNSPLISNQVARRSALRLFVINSDLFCWITLMHAYIQYEYLLSWFVVPLISLPVGPTSVAETAAAAT